MRAGSTTSCCIYGVRRALLRLVRSGVGNSTGIAILLYCFGSRGADRLSVGTGSVYRYQIDLAGQINGHLVLIATFRGTVTSCGDYGILADALAVVSSSSWAVKMVDMTPIHESLDKSSSELMP